MNAPPLSVRIARLGITVLSVFSLEAIAQADIIAEFFFPNDVGTIEVGVPLNDELSNMQGNSDFIDWFSFSISEEANVAVNVDSSFVDLQIINMSLESLGTRTHLAPGDHYIRATLPPFEEDVDG